MEMVDLIYPAGSSEIDLQVVGVIKQVYEAMYSGHSFHNFDFRELVDEYD